MNTSTQFQNPDDGRTTLPQSLRVLRTTLARQEPRPTGNRVLHAPSGIRNSKELRPYGDAGRSGILDFEFSIAALDCP